MLIKFKKPDPRDGATVRMDSSLGQRFIDMGHADRVAESWETAPSDPPKIPTASSDDRGNDPGAGEGGEGSEGADDALKQAALAFIEGNVPDVNGRIEGADKALLEAALAAESLAEKPRKGVVDALTAAIAAPQA